MIIALILVTRNTFKVISRKSRKVEEVCLTYLAVAEVGGLVAKYLTCFLASLLRGLVLG